MPIIRRKLDPNTVYPETLRYNDSTDAVESFVNGEWVENPEADPRTQTTYPPRITSDSACDAAQSVADALKANVDSTILAIDNAATGFTIAGTILGLFTFGVFGVFIGLALTLADTMIGIGGSALTAALTEGVYDQLKCIINCQMDDNGRLKSGGFAAIQGDVNSQIGGVAAVVLNAMLSLAGEGGVNNLASIGSSTGDCSECDCEQACIGEGAVLFGTLVAQTATYVDIQAEAGVYQGIPAYFAIYGSQSSDFCCMMCAWQVQSGAIQSGSLVDCAGNGSNGLPGMKRRAEFYHTTSSFVIRYTFDPEGVGC